MGYEFGFVPLNEDVSASVNSVFGRTGAVAASVGDYTAAQVTNAADKSSSSPQVFSGALLAPSASVASGLTSGSLVTGTGTFTSGITATSASVSGALTGTSVNGATGAFTGAVTASSASVSGALTGSSATITNAVTAGSATVSGTVTASSASVSGALSGSSLNSGTGTFTNAVTASSASVSGALTGSSLVLTGTTGPQFPSIGLNTPAPASVGTISSAPPPSHTTTAAFGSVAINTPKQNTLGYNIYVTVSVVVTAATGASFAGGVGSSSTPTTDPLTGSLSIATVIAFGFVVPNNYWLSITDSGTIALGSTTTWAQPL